MNKTERRKLTILRGSSQYVNPRSYNVQEIGLGKALTQMGWDVTIISSGKEEQTIVVNENLKWLELPRVGGNYGWPKNSLKLLLNQKSDIFQCQDISNLGTNIMYYVSRKKNVPLVLSLGEYRAKSWIKGSYAKLTSSYLGPHLSAVLCKTKEAVEYSNNLNLRNAIYAPVGIDHTVYENDEVRNPWLEKIAYLRSDNKKLLCHIGRLDKEDNLNFLLSLLSHLDNEYYLVLVGEPTSTVHSSELFQNIKNRVILTGKIENKYIGKILRLCNLYIACSKYEIFGMSAAESIYHDCPVIGFSTGGIVEIVKNQVNGVLLENRDPIIWASKIKEIFMEELSLLSEGCKKTKKDLTWEVRANSYSDVYQEILKKRG